jgi:hypothetical protein
MRKPLLLLAGLALACAGARADTVNFLRVWPQWHDADSFQSYYEYRHHQELVGGYIVMRTHADNRGGLYFLTRVKNRGPELKGASFVLQIISPESTATREFRFGAQVPGGSRLFDLGLTGTDWGGPKVEPVAWCLELRSADGTVLARQASFLWERRNG